MIVGRVWAQLSRVLAADAHACLDPRHDPNYADTPKPARTLAACDWEEYERLMQIAARCQVRACLEGWYPGDDPWASDADNEAARCLVWDEVF